MRIDYHLIKEKIESEYRIFPMFGLTTCYQTLRYFGWAASCSYITFLWLWCLSFTRIIPMCFWNSIDRSFGYFNCTTIIYDHPLNETKFNMTTGLKFTKFSASKTTNYLKSIVRKLNRSHVQEFQSFGNRNDDGMEKGGSKRQVKLLKSNVWQN